MQQFRFTLILIFALCYSVTHATNNIAKNNISDIDKRFIKTIRKHINNNKPDSAFYVINNTEYSNYIVKDIMRAEIFEATNEFGTAGKCYRKAYSNMVNKTDSLAWSTLLNIIIANDRTSNHEENKALISEANSILAKNYNAGYKAELLNIEAIIYNNMGYTEKAHSCIDSAIAINSRLNRFTDLSANYTTKANTYFRKRDYNSALTYFKRAYRTGADEKTDSRLIRNRINIAAAAHMCGRREEAISFYKEILSDSISHNISPELRAALYNNISGMYDEWRGYDTSLLYLDSAISIAGNIKDFRTLKTAYLHKAEINYYRENYKKAYRYNSIAAMYKDSLNAEKLIDAMAGVELNNRYLISEQKRHEENSVTEAENKLIKLFLIIITVITSVFASVVIILIRRNRYTKTGLKRSVNSFKSRHKEYLEVIKEISRMKDINISLKRNLSRAAFILQENISLYNRIDKILSKETDIPDKVKNIGNSVKDMQTMMKESDIINDNLEDNDIDLRIRIKQVFPELTKTDIKLCILIRSELSTKEIAHFTNTATGSVEVAKYRLRKKMGFESLNDMQKRLMTI
jgi:tetratricopeptide (TPR) repeat protein